MLTRTHIMLHHSLTPDSGTVSWSAIRRYHTRAKGHPEGGMGMRDIGYHWGVEAVADGIGQLSVEVLVGRPEDEEAAACPQGDMNEKAYHICVVGNFDIIEPSVVVQGVLVNRVLRPLLRRTGLSAENIVGHCDFNPAKTCPGKLFDLAAIRRLCR